MIQNPEPSAKDLTCLLTLDFDTGRMVWRNRPREFFGTDNACNSWNAKWAGKEAFTAIDGKGYRVGAVLNRLYRAHRVVWALYHGEWPDQDIDHINGDKQDNCPQNLRLVSHQENMRNLPLKGNNTSGVLGVCWDKRDRKWRANIKHEGRDVLLGYFWTIEAATRARRDAEAKYGYHANHGRAAS